MITDETLRDYTNPYAAYRCSDLPEMAKELLERREKDPKPEPVEKSLKSPITDGELEAYLADEPDTYDDCQYTYSLRRELLEYRRRTRRTHYQEGDFASGPRDSKEAVLCQLMVGRPLDPDVPLFIPLDSLKDLHE